MNRLRYILDNNGYLYDVSIGADISCDFGACVEYAGTVPTGYETIDEWFLGECEKLNAWKIVDGNLVFDEIRYAELEKQAEKNTYDNSHVTRAELEKKLSNVALSEDQISFVLSNAKEVAKILPIDSDSGKIVKITDASNNALNSIEITSNSNVTGEVKLVINGTNIFKNTGTSSTSNGIECTIQDDKSMKINGTSTTNVEYIIGGTSTSEVPLFVLKSGTTYYLNELPSGVSMTMYNYSNSELTQIYEGNGGETITLSADGVVTYVTLEIASGTYNEVVVRPMLSLGNTPKVYETYKERVLEIPLGDYTFETNNVIYINSDGEVILTKGSQEVSLDNAIMPSTFEGVNILYTMQDTSLDVEYKTDGFYYVTKRGTGTLTLKHSADGYGSIHKITVKDLVAGSTYKLKSSNANGDFEEYSIDLTTYTGTVDLIIEDGKTSVYQNNEEIGTLKSIFVKTYSPKTFLEIEEGEYYITCEYMLESDFSVYCTRVEKNASIQALEDKIQLEVTRASGVEGELSSRITVEADKIEQVISSVGKDGGVTVASILSAIKDGLSSIKINANQIQLEGDSINLTGEISLNPAYFYRFKNMIDNSSFEIFDGTTKIPLGWDNGEVSADASMFGTYSLKLLTNQTAKQTSKHQVDVTWLKDSYNTSDVVVCFYNKFDPVIVQVYDVVNEEYLSLVKLDNNLVESEASTSIEFPTRENWNQLRCMFKFTPLETTHKVRIEFTCGTGTHGMAFVDAPMMEPYVAGDYPSMYKDGKYSVSAYQVLNPPPADVDRFTSLEHFSIGNTEYDTLGNVTYQELLKSNGEVGITRSCSNPDENGYYKTIVETFYNQDGDVNYVDTYSYTYSSTGAILSKVRTSTEEVM